MSHFLKITIACTNAEAIVRALMRMDLPASHNDWLCRNHNHLIANQIEVHDKATNLYGYRGDKSENKANIIVRHANIHCYSTDIGFEKQSDGTYAAHLDDGSFNQEWQNKFLTYYGVEVAKMEAEKAGHTCTEVIDKKGRIELHVDYTIVEKAKTGGIKIMKW